MSKPRVLLADDNIDLADALRSLLEGEVELVGVVHDGLALVQAAQELRPDVIITDLSMPRMNGLEAVLRLKRDGITARIIFLTEYQEPQLIAEAFRIGASAYLSKLAACEQLVDIIHEVVAAQREAPIAGRRKS